MDRLVVSIVVIAVSVLVTAQLMGATMRWSRGRGLVRRPRIVEAENQERLWKAKADRARGWRELFRSIGQFMMIAILVFALGIILGSEFSIW